MTYPEAIDFLYSETASFEASGAEGYKPGLERVEALLDHFGNPHRGLRTIHIAGTNGKGSVASLIASILTSSGYKVGLFTSPHLVDFRERIRIDGEMIPEERVTAFVDRAAPLVRNKTVDPSFFELTTAMAFDYFRAEGVDYAVIETGMGGRLDSTNVILPLVSIITNVSMDHMQYLGETLLEIAGEKAGIIKPFVPVVLGRSREPEVKRMVTEKAAEMEAPLVMADREPEIMMYFMSGNGYKLSTIHFGNLTLPLLGAFQIENAAPVLQTLLILRERGIEISQEAVREGFLKVSDRGLMGRLQVLRSSSPRIIIDSGHNPAAWYYLAGYLRENRKERNVVTVLGFSEDKDIEKLFSLIPSDLTIIFTKAHTPRAKSETALLRLARENGMTRCYSARDIADAFALARDFVRDNPDNSTIFVGGSFYLTGEFLEYYRRECVPKAEN